MAIEATAILPSDSLEEFRVQFNNLISDVDGISGGNSFVSSIIFEGSTADAYETTVFATDPSSDNTITLPDATGTVITTANAAAGATTTSSGDVDHILVNDGGVLKKITSANLGVGVSTTMTLVATNSTDASHFPVFVDTATGAENPRTDTGFTYNPSDGTLTSTIFAGTLNGNVVVANDGDVGSTGATDAMQISSAGIVTFKDDILIKDGGTIGNASVAAVMTLASSGIVTLVDDLILKDAATIGVTSSTSAITIASTGIVTLVDDLVLKDAATIGVTSQPTAMTIASTGIVTFIDDILLKDAATIGNASVAAVMTLASTGIVTFVDDIILKDAATIGVTSSTSAISIASTGIVTLVDDLVLKDAATIGVTSSLSAITIASTGIVTFVDDILLKDVCTIGTATTAGAIAIAADGTVDLATAGATVNSVAVKVAGKESIWVPAAAMYPSTTNGCADIEQVETTALRPDLKCLDFDPSSDEFAQFSVAFPKSWNEGTVTFQPFWTVTGTNTGTVAWQLGGIAASSDDSINTAFGTLVATTALAHSGTSNDLMVSVESGAVTIAGSPAVADCCFFQINRDISADAQTGDARLLGIKLFFTTNAANDA